MKVTQRINRILFIMSYVSQHPGVEVAELAQQVGLKPSQLIREMDFMLLIGKPPFRPDDYIDIYVEDDCVYIEFDQMLNRPLRFTRPEAMALLMSLQLLDNRIDPAAVASLKSKIRKTISNSSDPSSSLQDRIAFENSSTPVSRQFSRLRQSISQHRKVVIDYFSLTRNQTGKRTVRPYFLTKSLGYWYLTGYCELRTDLRTFKFERMLGVQLLSSTFEAPRDLDFAHYKKNFLNLMGKHKVEIHFAAPVAPWVREKWSQSIRECNDGGVILRLSSETLEFPTRLVLEHAPYARPLKPPRLVEKVRQAAQEVMALYQSASNTLS